MDHWHHFAYLRGNEQAVTALSRFAPTITEASVMPAERSRVDRPVLCIDVEPLDTTPDGLQRAIANVNSTAFEGFLRSNPVPTWDNDDPVRVFERERARVRAMIWLSQEIGGPVAYWYHEGDNGMVADHFLGFGGPSASMWPDQVSEWDEARPRSAYTAALWHIGAQVPNVNEYESMFRAFGSPWPRVPVEALSEARMRSLAAEDPLARWRVWGPPGSSNY